MLLRNCKALNAEYNAYAATFDRLMRKVGQKSLDLQTRADIWTACGALLAAMARNPMKDEYWAARFDRHEALAASFAPEPVPTAEPAETAPACALSLF